MRPPILLLLQVCVYSCNFQVNLVENSEIIPQFQLFSRSVCVRASAGQRWLYTYVVVYIEEAAAATTERSDHASRGGGIASATKQPLIYRAMARAIALRSLIIIAAVARTAAGHNARALAQCQTACAPQSIFMCININIYYIVCVV